MRRVTTNVRNGLSLLAVAAICELIALAMGVGDATPGDPADLAQGAAILFAIGGLALIVVGLIKKT